MKTNTYLLQLFGSKARIVREIWSIDLINNPFIAIVYYHSFHQGVLQRLHAATNSRIVSTWDIS
jgi:hypothetical protein